MALPADEFAVHRFIRDLFEDLGLTLPALGCAFEGSLATTDLTVQGSSQMLRNKLFLLFADLAGRSSTLAVRFEPTVKDTDVALEFHCAPFDPEATTFRSWDSKLFDALPQQAGFRLTVPKGSPPDWGPPVHWAQLAQLYGGLAQGRKVLETFVDRCRTLVAELGTAVEEGDGARVLRCAHTIKGSARGVTAHALAEAAFQLELLGRSGELGGAPDLYKALRQTYDQFILWVEGQA